MKKLFTVLMIMALSVATLVSCGESNREYDEAEVKAAAKTLIEASSLLNEVYWGDGIPYNDNKNTSDGVYYEAEYIYHHRLGFDNIAELMELTEKTFSKDYSQSIYSTLLNSIQDGDKAIILSRYYQKYSAADGKTPESIMVNSTWVKIFLDDVTYDYDSIKVIGSEGEKVYVTINATVSRAELDPQVREIRIALVEEDAGWRIDSPTFLNYDTTNLK